MKPTSIKLLLLLLQGPLKKTDLTKKLGIKEPQTNIILRELNNQDYLEIKDEIVKLKQNPKTILFRDIANKYDAYTLLRDSNEKIFYLLSEPLSITELAKKADLSDSTVFRAVAELESIGSITRTKQNIYIDGSKDQLLFFAKLLKKETERAVIEDYAEIIYKDETRILKRIPKGKIAEGELTAFSLFSDYGIEYVTAYDYYIREASSLKLEDVIMNSLLIAQKDNDKNALSLTILLYLKNRGELDTLALRNIARSYGIRELWLDIEGYVRYNQVKSQQLFPTRKEFEEKARLYNISLELMQLPTAYPQLFEAIGKNLHNDVSAYLLGGENMRIKKLKDSTKDCDVVVTDAESFTNIRRALENIGYKSINKMQLTTEDLRIGPSDILVRGSWSRIDIFTNTISRKLYLSNRMMERAEVKQFGRLLLGILKNEDVFLLKAVTDREGDIHDMARLVQNGKFDWDILWNELVHQEHETRHDLYSFFMDQIDSLNEQTGIKPSFYKKLLRNVIDSRIERLIRDGGMPFSEIVSLLTSHDVTEKAIRHRIDYLQKKKRLRKSTIDNKVIIQPRKGNVLNIQSMNPISSAEKLDKYIQSFSIKLNLPSSVESRAKELGRTISASSHFIRFRPRNLAAAAIFLTAKNYGSYVDTDKLSRNAEVSKPSIHLLSKKISKEFMNVMISEECQKGEHSKCPLSFRFNHKIVNCQCDCHPGTIPATVTSEGIIEKGN